MMDKENGVSPVIGVMLMIVVTIVIAAVVSALAGGIGSEKKAGPSLSLGSQLKYDPAGVPTCPVTTWTITYTKPDGTTFTKTMQACGRSSGGVPQGMGPNKDGLVFTHGGGDPIDLKDLEMQVSGGDIDITLDYSNLKYGVPALGVCYGGSTPGYKCTTSDGVITNISAYSATDTRWNSYTATQLMAQIPSRYFYKLGPDGLVVGDTIIRPGDSFIWLVDNNNGNIGGDWASPARQSTYWAIKTIDKYGKPAAFGIERGTDNRWQLSHKPSGEVLAHGTFEFPNT